MDFLSSPEFQQAIANIILLVISTGVAAIAKVAYTYIKTNTSTQQFSILEQIAASAVSAAEQGAIAGFVQDRKGTAIAIVNEGLKNAGIKNLTAEQIDAAIEAAVKDGLNYNKQVNSPATPDAEPVPAEDPEVVEVVDPDVQDGAEV